MTETTRMPSLSMPATSIIPDAMPQTVELVLNNLIPAKPETVHVAAQPSPPSVNLTTKLQILEQ